MARNNIKSATDQRRFTMVYNDFLDSELLDRNEKLLFIAIKRYADNETLKAFPSYGKLSKITGISRRHIIRCIASLEEKGVLHIEHKKSDDGNNAPNLYTLYDMAEIWKAKSTDEVAQIIKETEEERYIRFLESKGYTVTKKEDPVLTDQSKGTRSSKNNKNIRLDENIPVLQTNVNESERYSRDEILKIFEYEILKNDLRDKLPILDSFMEILYRALNTTNKTIRVAGEDKATNLVIAELIKLDMFSIRFAIEQYEKQTGKINNPESYALTLLYKARLQQSLSIHNLYKQNEGKV